MTPDQNKQLIRGFIDQVINQGHLDAAGDYMAEDVVELEPFPGQQPGLAGVKEVVQGMRSAFRDMHWTVEEQIAEGDKVLTRFTWTGTHEASFFGVPATHRKVSVGGMVIDRIEAGKVQDTRIQMDVFGLMRQLGA
ncbi:ester cyclase [Roseomonas frigidaquae]|uniref:Ester cyclase n=1 Tax=Falsiroseomonas frigidaquae TaxID=487318 RepID=A0ABX1F0U2_9PROT|nr:ester cyclase [Falsiroseomonas frigidaquae]NKE45931.1 ester cyclase [Falsiroseomonas frigidaquae]